jgi:hypothetical protein
MHVYRGAHHTTASVEYLILEVPDALDLPGLLVDTKRLESDFRTFIILSILLKLH